MQTPRLHFSLTDLGYDSESMATFVQDTSVQLPADEASTWVESYQTGIYTGTVLATMVTYDAGEYPMKLVFE